MCGEGPLTGGALPGINGEDDVELLPAPFSVEGAVDGGGRGFDRDGVGEADTTVDKGEEGLNKGTLL